MIVRKIKTVFRYFVKDELLSLLYERLFVQTIPLFYGMMWLKFYGLVHTNLRVGKPISCWGRPILRMSIESEVRMGRNILMVSDPVRSTIAI